ncbi:MAG: hypothetical protein R6X31_12215 [Anaerolineae bacterium]
MATTIARRRLLRIGWLVPLVLLITVGCAPTPTPTPSPTPPPSTPTPTPLPTDTPSPTPTPTATSEPTPPADPLVPAGPITPPPPDFQPTPSPPPDPGAEDEQAWVRDYVEVVTAMLNSGEDVQAVLDTLIAWSSPSDEVQDELTSFAWAESADLDGDGTEEWLIALPVPERGCGVTWCPAYSVIFEFEQGLFNPRAVVRGAPPDEIQMQSPELRLIDDVNADGETEVLIQQHWCGAHTCFTGLTVGRWDGATWRDLAADPIDQAYTDLTIDDRDGDGALEFILHGGMFGSVGAGLQRQHTLIFKWEDGAYRLVQDTPDPSDHPYYLVLDANTALAEGDWDRALELAEQAVNNPDFEDSMVPVEEVDQRRIISYAAVEAMLVYAHRGDVAQMEAVLNQIRGYDFLEPNVYTEAAGRLLDVYRDTGDVVEACAAMEDLVAQQPDEAVFFQWYGYNTARITVDQICPLDPPAEGDSPQL